MPHPRRLLFLALPTCLIVWSIGALLLFSGCTPTPTPSATPTPCPACGGLPAHILTGYWQDFTNNATPLRLSAVNGSYNFIAVAFAGAGASKGQITFRIDARLSAALGGYTALQFSSDVATLHAQGKKILLSVGGAAGTITIDDATSATNFATSAYGLMQTYGFDGVDIDLEKGINVPSLTGALQQLSALVGHSLIITLAPQAVDVQSPSSPYFQLALNIKTILTLVNTQYYNSGSMHGCDGKVYAPASEDFLTSLACILLQGGLRPDQVGLGLPASTLEARKGYVTPAVVDDALDCLATGSNCGSFLPPATYPTIRGAMTWSINWDAANSYNFANTVGPYLNTLP
jgi:chitinase